ncbi:Holliday junction resolvase RecU [Lysinibacillus fusiformis]|uniref:Holliday junction resolvase RecU n=1 Tax=Lysinibacillus fusiformis TaxID=28031 RepID=UPI00263A6E2F|nr:Holliday junction resolvase RecU [Lysinibacillus fusiformis]MDC6267745.1 Holliday junction resolvase RecU [Lysinibacillus sphaericus]MDN4967765.1 Holliday junction resolvase RecU [Lysinibacillus fusiformis]MDN4967821.1 Holliday junction resolvase RecU [Lysinibacillus fusiformis]
MRKQKQSYSRSHANRGKVFENLIDGTNKQYRNNNFADVRKVPTPVRIVEAEGKNVEGKFGSASWVDYSGVYKGQAIIFDAKEIRRGTNFPLKNLTKKQYEQLHSWNLNGAKAFLLICFWIEGKNEPEIYLLKFEQLETAWVAAQQGGSKHIPIQFFRDHCPRIRSGIYTVHYLEAVGVD